MPQHGFHQLLEAEDLRAAELVGPPGNSGILDDTHDPCRDVADIDRLESGIAAADQRYRRRQARDPREAIEKVVLYAENDAGPDHDRVGKRLPHRFLARRLAPRVYRRRVGRGADGGDVDHALDAGGGGGLRAPPGAFRMDRLETLRTRLVEHADEVDRHVSALDGGGHRRVVADVRRDRRDLTDIAHGLEEERAFRPPDGDADAVAPAGELAHGIAADEAGTAEHGCCGRRHRAPLDGAANIGWGGTRQHRCVVAPSGGESG